MKDIQNVVNSYLLNHEKQKKYLAVVLALSMLVTFIVPLILTQSAESMTRNNGILATQLGNATASDGVEIVTDEAEKVKLLVGANKPEITGSTVEETLTLARSKYLLGIASQFGVFLEGDFSDHSADVESRLAVGGGANVSDKKFINNEDNDPGDGIDPQKGYEIGNGKFDAPKTSLDKLLNNWDFAEAIVLGGPFRNILTESHDNYILLDGTEGKLSKTFVIGSEVDLSYAQKDEKGNYTWDYQQYSPDSFRKTDEPLIDFAKEFANLRRVSEKLATQKSDGAELLFSKDKKSVVYENYVNNICDITALSDGGYWGGNMAHFRYTGDMDTDVVKFNVTYEEWEAVANKCALISYEGIPENANIIVSVAGTEFNLTPQYKYTYVNGVQISVGGSQSVDGSTNIDPGNNSEYCERLLYNFSTATKIVIDQNFAGNIFAPNAEVGNSRVTNQGHLSGALIAKSFNGALEIGYRPYQGSIDLLGSTSGYTIPVDKFKTDGETHLAGADFSLTITDESGSVVTSWKSGNDTEYVTIPTMLDFTGGETYTDTNKVQSRTYTIKEVNAPAGYIGTTKEYQLQVTETVDLDSMITGEGNGTIPTNVDVNIIITPVEGNTAGEETTLSFKISDEYSEDAQTMRKITIDGKQFWLVIDDQKVVGMVRPTGEMTTSSYESEGTTTYTETVDSSTTVIHEVTKTEVASTEVPVTLEGGETTLDGNNNPIMTLVPATTGVDAVDEGGNSYTSYSTVTQVVTGVVTETVVATDAESSAITVEGGSTVTEVRVVSSSALTDISIEVGMFTSSYMTSTDKTYIIYTDIPVTESLVADTAVLASKGILNFGDTTETETRYYFDPNSLMLMPMPANNLEFINEYGFQFKKVDEGGNLVTGATIALEKKLAEGAEDTSTENGNVADDGYEVVNSITASSLTIDPETLNANTLYRFRESVVPDGYEPAVPVYLVKLGTGSDTKIYYCTSASEPAMPTEESSTGWTMFRISAPDGSRVISMTDQKIHGYKLVLNKADANTKKLLNGAYFKLCAANGTTVYPTVNLYTDDASTTDVDESQQAGFKINGTLNLFEELKKAAENTYDSNYVEDGYLKKGTYYLEEVKAPDGYEQAGMLRFRINYENGEYSMEILSSDAPQYFTVEGVSTTHGTEIWANVTATDVSKIEIKVSSPADGGKIVLYQDTGKTGYNLHDIRADVVNGVATFEFADPLSSIFEFKICNGNDWNAGVTVEEVRVYGTESDGSSSGSTETEKTDFGEGITVDHTNKVITMNSTGLARITDEMIANDAVVLKLTFVTSDKEMGWGNAKFTGNANGTEYKQVAGSYLPAGCNSSEYQGVYSIGFNQTSVDVQIKVSDICKIFGIETSQFRTISSFGLTWWNSTTVKNVDFPCFETTSTTSPEPTEPSESTTTAVVNAAPLETNESGELVIPNSRLGANMALTVQKAWQDDESYGSFARPDSITVELKRQKPKEGSTTEYEDDTSFSQQITLNAENEWSYVATLQRLINPADSTDNSTYRYYVKEIGVPKGYKVTYENNSGTDSGGIIQIKNKLELISLNVEKTWNAPAGTGRPASINVKLQYYDEDESIWKDVPDSTQSLTGSEWKCTYSDLPSGYKYRAVEVKVPTGWIASNNGQSNESSTSGDTLTITNTLKVGKLNLVKRWANGAPTSGSIKVRLYRATVRPGTGGNAGSGNTATVTPTEPTDATGGYDQTSDYSRLLQYSLYFYDANMCGTEVTEKSAVSWRDDCHTSDEIPGGFHDAGDHVMFGLPQGYAASTLGWSYYEFKDSFEKLGLTKHYKTIMQHFCDFFVAATDLNDTKTAVDKVLYQKGNGGDGYDHSYWGIPENQPEAYTTNENKKRSDYMLWTTSTDGADITAEYAAALAAYALNFPEDDCSETYLNYAKMLYDYSTQSGRGATTSVPQYNTNTYLDDQAWAAGWLYLATKGAGESAEVYNRYKNDCASKQQTIDWVNGWAKVNLGAACLYAAHIDDNHNWNAAKNYISGQIDNGNYVNGYYCPDDWGSARLNASVQMTALVAAKYSDDIKNKYNTWSKGQMAYILGNNTIASNDKSSTCFVTGFADNSSKSVHHRAASGYSGSETISDKSVYSENGRVLVGALVGGPNKGGNYSDIMDGNNMAYQTNEVALDYNAVLVGAAAGLYSVYGTGTLADSLDDFPAKSGIEILYPASTATSQQTLTLRSTTTQQSQKATSIKGISMVGSDVKAKATTLYTDENGTYFVITGNDVTAPEDLWCEYNVVGYKLESTHCTENPCYTYLYGCGFGNYEQINTYHSITSKNLDGSKFGHQNPCGDSSAYTFKIYVQKAEIITITIKGIWINTPSSVSKPTYNVQLYDNNNQWTSQYQLNSENDWTVQFKFPKEGKTYYLSGTPHFYSNDWNNNSNAVASANATSGICDEDATITITNTYTGSVPMETFTLDPATATVQLGKTVTLIPKDAAEGSFTWESSNTNIATVDNGVVTALRNGEVTITATDSTGKKAYAKITVSPMTISSITSTSLNIGETTIIKLGNPGFGAIGWKVTDSNGNEVNDIATVTSFDNNEATITAKKGGDFYVTATDANGNFVTSDKITVNGPSITAPDPITEGQTGTITISGLTGSYTVKLGDTELTGSNNSYSFTAPDVDRATQYTISVVMNNETVVTKVITVNPFAITQDGAVVTEYSSNVTLTANAPATWTVQDGYSGNITLTPIDNGMSCVVNGGEYTSGTITVTATYGENSDTAAITMSMSNSLELSIVENKTVLRIGDIVTLNAQPSNNVTYSVNPADCITFDESSMKITALAEGTVTITGTRNNATDSVTLTIHPALTLTGDDTMNAGETQKLRVAGNIGNLTWTSDKPEKVTVDQNGNVTAVENGEAIITVTDAGNDPNSTADDATATFKITVKQSAVNPNLPTEKLHIADIEISGSGDQWTTNRVVATYNGVTTLNLGDLPTTDGNGNTYYYYIEEILDGNETLVTGNAVYIPSKYENNGAVPSENGNTISVENTKISDVQSDGQMPSAGGEGTTWYYIAGAAMMLAGIAGYFVLKRKQWSER